MERSHGIITLLDTAFTGIQVDLVDVSRLDFENCDSFLSESLKEIKLRGEKMGIKSLVVNIDYAFGMVC